MATPAVSPQATAWDVNGNPVAPSGPTAWDANGNPTARVAKLQAAPAQSTGTIGPAPSVAPQLGMDALRVSSDPMGSIGNALDLLQQKLAGSDHPLAREAAQHMLDAKELLFGGQAAGKPMGTKSGVVNNPVTQAIAGAVPLAEAAPAVEEGLGKIAPHIPSASDAGEAFEEVANVANDMPVDVSTPGNTALKIQEMSQQGGSMPKIIRDFLRRTTEPDAKPLTYEEARGFYQNATRLSSAESSRLTPVMRRQVAMFTQELSKSIEGAADTAGKLEQLQGAMKEYHQAMNMQRTKELIKDSAISAIKKGIPYGVAFWWAHKLWTGE